MLIARPFDRPIVIDETNFHYLAVPSWNRMLQLPHAERVAALRDPGDARRAARRGRALQPRPRARHDRPAAAVERTSTSTRSRSPSTRPLQSRSIADLARRAGRRARRRGARPRPRRRPRHRVPVAHREPGVDRGGGRGPARRRAWSSARPTAVRTWPATTAPTGAPTSCAPGCCDRQRLDARGGHPPDHPVPAALLGFADRGVLAPGAPGRSHGLRPRDDRPVEEGVRARPARAGSAASRPGAGACRPPSSTASRSCSTASSPAGCPVGWSGPGRPGR